MPVLKVNLRMITVALFAMHFLKIESIKPLYNIYNGFIIVSFLEILFLSTSSFCNLHRRTVHCIQPQCGYLCLHDRAQTGKALYYQFRHYFYLLSSYHSMLSVSHLSCRTSLIYSCSLRLLKHSYSTRPLQTVTSSFRKRRWIHVFWMNTNIVQNWYRKRSW